MPRSPRTTTSANLTRLTINFPTIKYQEVVDASSAIGISMTEYIRTATSVLKHLGNIGITDHFTITHNEEKRDILLPFSLQPSDTQPRVQHDIPEA